MSAAPPRLASVIEHTLLRPDARREEIVRLCAEARQFGFVGVCVNGSWVSLAAEQLAGSPVKLVAVVGFPLGAMASRAKAWEAREAVREGATEIDMVIHLGALKGRELARAQDDIAQVVAASGAAPVKVILETAQLTEEEKIIGCELSVAAGAAFVKTSTGFNGAGATVEDVALMRRVVGPDFGVKASGGIRTLEAAQRMLEAGANRLGTSASVAIVSAQ